MKPMEIEHWATGVVIPARDEAGSIAACLESVFEALARSGQSQSNSWVVVVADSCRDTTVSQARQVLKGRGSVLECSLSSPGAARRLGAAEILSHFAPMQYSRVWLANTDADTCVAPDWIARQLELADRGYCGVAGIVCVERVEGLDRQTLSVLLTDYTINDDGTHPHVHGANLGVRADAYIDAGCWSPIPLAEDHCLWSRVRARGWPTAACSRTVVYTSGRLYGRAVGGFADSLRKRLDLLQAGALTCTP